VTGLTLADATKRLEEKGFKLQAGEPVANANVPEGQVVSQVPPADTPAEKGKVVAVQVSAGAAEVAVPKVMGLSIGNAKTALEKVGLEGEVRWVSLAETPTFVVLNQKPRPNDKVKPGSKVELVANQ
jgi:serine/threonine-protein kinase